MNKKIIYLFLALLLPALVFVFLKYFGKNEFDIPIYYADGVIDLPSACTPVGVGQYKVSNSKIQWAAQDGFAAIATFVDKKDIRDLQERIAENHFDRIQIIPLEAKDSELRDCVLFMKEPWNAVLIDSQKRIRGYYKLGNREEMDRLEVELKILLKKY